MGSMLDPNMTLFYSAVAEAAEALIADPEGGDAWSTVAQACTHYEVKAEDNAELCAAIDGRDAPAFTAMIQLWGKGEGILPERDRDVLKRAMKAYRKSFKVTKLDAESSLGGGPMSSGRKSSIVGITPPRRYPREVWDYLVLQGRLIGGDRGTYELPPGG